MRYRHRWWFRLTGLPGWMRFGFFSNWMVRRQMLKGQYLRAGSWPIPQMRHPWQKDRVLYFSDKGFPMPGVPTFHDSLSDIQLTQEQELEMLKAQARELKEELEAIEKRIQALGGKK